MVYFYSPQTYLYSEFKKINNWEIKQVKNISNIVKKLSESNILALDTETTGLNPLVNQITMIQFGNEKDQFVIDTRGLDFSTLYPIFNKDILFIGHNLKFDYNMLKKHGIVLNKIYDTMLSEMVLKNGKYTIVDIKTCKPYSLKTLTKNYLNIDIGKETREEFVTWGNRPFTIQQILYGAKDVLYPLEIMKLQKFHIKKHKLEKTVSLEFKSSLALGDIEYNGFYINKNSWIKTTKEFKLKLKNTLIELDNILIEKNNTHKKKEFQLSLFDDVINDKYTRLTNINWNSPPQVIDILTKDFNIYPKNKDGKISSGTPALKLLENKPDIVTFLLKFRKQSKAISSFGEEFLRKSLHPDNRIRTTFNSIVETGRVSSRNPNMQQIPKDVAFRSCFQISTPDHILITADYSNQEGRIMADMSKDEAYIDFFNNGDGDAHSFIARTLFSAAEGKPVDVQNDENHPNFHLRHQGKILNFFISFGGSAHTLSQTLKISKEEAEYLIKNFYKGFPGLKKMFDKNSLYALNNGYIRTNSITNRIRWMKGWETYQQLVQKNRKDLTKEERSELGKMQGKIRRKGMNTPIQGTAGDMTKTALILLRNKLLSYNIKPFLDASIKIVSVVHDEISLEVKKEFRDLASKILKESMEKAGKYYCKKVVMPAIPVISDVWKH